MTCERFSAMRPSRAPNTSMPRRWRSGGGYARPAVADMTDQEGRASVLAGTRPAEPADPTAVAS